MRCAGCGCRALLVRRVIVDLNFGNLKTKEKEEKQPEDIISEVESSISKVSRLLRELKGMISRERLRNVRND